MFLTHFEESQRFPLSELGYYELFLRRKSLTQNVIITKNWNLAICIIRTKKKYVVLYKNI